MKKSYQNCIKNHRHLHHNEIHFSTSSPRAVVVFVLPSTDKFTNFPFHFLSAAVAAVDAFFVCFTRAKKQKSEISSVTSSVDGSKHNSCVQFNDFLHNLIPRWTFAMIVSLIISLFLMLNLVLATAAHKLKSIFGAAQAHSRSLLCSDRNVWS